MPSDAPTKTHKINKTKKFKSNEVVVNYKSNFKSHLVKCQDIMDDMNLEQCVIRGMGRATTRALNLALQLNSNNSEAFKLIPQTYTVEIPENKSEKVETHKGALRNQYDPNQIDPKTISYIPAVAIVVRKSDAELNKTRMVKEKFKSMNS